MSLPLSTEVVTRAEVFRLRDDFRRLNSDYWSLRVEFRASRYKKALEDRGYSTGVLTREIEYRLNVLLGILIRKDKVTKKASPQSNRKKMHKVGKEFDRLTRQFMKIKGDLTQLRVCFEGFGRYQYKRIGSYSIIGGVGVDPRSPPIVINDSEAKDGTSMLPTPPSSGEDNENTASTKAPTGGVNFKTVIDKYQSRTKSRLIERDMSQTNEEQLATSIRRGLLEILRDIKNETPSRFIAHHVQRHSHEMRFFSLNSPQEIWEHRYGVHSRSLQEMEKEVPVPIPSVGQDLASQDNGA